MSSKILLISMKKIDIQELTIATKTSISYAEVLKKLGLKQSGSMQSRVKNEIKNLGLDISHFTGQSWCRGKNSYQDKRIRKKYTEEFIFKENSEVSNKVVKNRLMSNPSFEHKCELCSIKNWYDPFETKIKPVNLELDHINGNERDNRKENLRLICSNCHSFTPTYKGRNINGGIRKGENKISDNVLLEHLKTKNIRQSLISVGMAASGENYERCKILKNQLTSEEDVVR
jgi:hypothetical protein